MEGKGGERLSFCNKEENININKESGGREFPVNFSGKRRDSTILIVLSEEEVVRARRIPDRDRLGSRPCEKASENRKPLESSLQQYCVLLLLLVEIISIEAEDDICPHSHGGAASPIIPRDVCCIAPTGCTVVPFSRNPSSNTSKTTPTNRVRLAAANAT